MLKEKIKKLYNGIVGESLRYVVAGGATTLVDLGATALFYRVFSLGEQLSNVLAIILAILFAYVVNKLFVFRAKTETTRELAGEFVRFVAGRLLGMAIEIGGVWLFVNVLGQKLMVGKIETLVLVTVINYFVTKFLAFGKHKTAKNGENETKNDKK